VPDNLMAFSDSVIQRFSRPQAAPFTEEDARGYFAGRSRPGCAARKCSLLSLGPRKRMWCWEVPLSLYALNLELRSAVVGYWLVPQARGRGVASTAVRLLATWGSRRWGWLGSS
jgi:RimJ/RimL family protein N-acetyltransferase